jgi:RNA polymerase sigma factor
VIKDLDDSVFISKNDKDLREEIISDYKPFIRSVTKKTFNRYMEYGYDDELSIAMIAFNEAIDSYEPEKGHFLPFSAWVIKRRLIDYIRKNKSEYLSVPIEEDKDDDEVQISSIDHLAVMEYKESVIAEFRRYEISEYITCLNRYSITLDDMYKTSPKHRQTNKMIDEAISYLMREPDLIKEIKDKGMLPLKILTEELDIPRKTLERSRKYIVGVILLRTGDYDYLNGFIRWEKK